MNFKLIILLVLATSCGLKTKPKAPTSTLLPSFESEYSKVYKQKHKKEQIQKDKKQETNK